MQTKTVAQLRDFVGKLGGLQTEHQALRLRASISRLLRIILDLAPDTGLSELIVPLTRTEIFNKSLEIQQSERIFESCSNAFIIGIFRSACLLRDHGTVKCNRGPDSPRC